MFRVVASADDRFQIGQLRSRDRALGRHGVEDLDHVVAADRAVGIQALDELRQVGVLQVPKFEPAVTLTVAVPVSEPLLAVIVSLAALLGAVNSPAGA